MDGYEIVTKYFEEWIKPQTFLDRFYVAVFSAKRSKISFEQYEDFCELFEYDFDGKGNILWSIDWCEGEDDIINIRFYSLNDIKGLIANHERYTPINLQIYNRKGYLYENK